MNTLVSQIDCKISELLQRIRPGSSSSNDLAVAGTIKALSEARGILLIQATAEGGDPNGHTSDRKDPNAKFSVSG